MIRAAGQAVYPFSVILVWKLARFTQNREDSIIYKSLLGKHGVQVVSVDEPVEDSPWGRLLEGIIKVIDQFYSANLSKAGPGDGQLATGGNSVNRGVAVRLTTPGIEVNSCI